MVTRQLRIFAGGVGTETNVFSPIPTGLPDFEVARADDGQDARSRRSMGSTFARYANVAASEDCVYVQGIFAWATPAGLSTRVAYETLRDRLLDEVRAALPLDGVLLSLHGAMVADGYPDCETDLVERVRELVGSPAKIGALLDLHCDVPDELVEAADVIVTFKEYPHVDIDQRASELASLVIAAAKGESEPKMATFDCRMIGMYPTATGAMRAFVDRMSELEQQPGILSISLAHGFPWGNAPTARMVVVTDGDRSRAAALAAGLGHDFFSQRHDVNLVLAPLPEALDRALSSPGSDGPVVIADVADNAGGGAPSDSTFVLRELLERNVERVALGLLWDPIVVQQAFAAGRGARLTVRLGGKMGASSGDPLDLTVDVHELVPELVQRWPQEDGFVKVPSGAAARLTCDGVDIVVGAVRQQVLGLEVFTALGIDPTERRLLVVKSTNHFHAAFAPIASEVIYASTPGALDFDVRALPYENVDTNVFPLTEDPWNLS